MYKFRAGSVVTGIALLSLTAGCGQSKAVVEPATEVLAQQLRRSVDDTALLVRRSGVGVSAWTSSIQAARTRYAALPDQARSLACSTLTGIAGDYLKGAAASSADAPLDAGHRMSELAKSLAGSNRSVAVDQLRQELRSAAGDAIAGKPVGLIVLSLQTGVCGV